MATGPQRGAEPGTLRHSALSPPRAAADNRHTGIEFRHLRYFAAVAEELHFGRAAARLYISQPGLSQAIARLERELAVQLFIRTPSRLELTEAGAELLYRARRFLAKLEDTVARVRMVERGETGLLRVGVALLAEPAIASALKAFQEDHQEIVLDCSAMVSERLLAQLQEGRLHAAVIHQVPTLATVEGVASEPLRRGRLAVLAAPESKLALREAVTLSELSGETFLANPRSRAPAAFEGLKLMCRAYGGFDAKVLESAIASTVTLNTDWRPIQDGTAIAVMAEPTAHAVRASGIAVVPIQPPPQYVLALAWRSRERAAAARRFLAYLRRYRDRHAWITDPAVAPLTHDHRPSPTGDSNWAHSPAALTKATLSNGNHRQKTGLCFASDFVRQERTKIPSHQTAFRTSPEADHRLRSERELRHLQALIQAAAAGAVGDVRDLRVGADWPGHPAGGRREVEGGPGPP